MKLPENFEKAPELKLSQRLGSIFHDLDDKQLEILGDKALEARDLTKDLTEFEQSAEAVIAGAKEDEEKDKKAHEKLTELMYQVVSGRQDNEPHDDPHEKEAQELEETLNQLKDGEY